MSDMDRPQYEISCEGNNEVRRELARPRHITGEFVGEIESDPENAFVPCGLQLVKIEELLPGPESSAERIKDLLFSDRDDDNDAEREQQKESKEKKETIPAGKVNVKVTDEYQGKEKKEKVIKKKKKVNARRLKKAMSEAYGVDNKEIANEEKKKALLDEKQLQEEVPALGISVVPNVVCEEGEKVEEPREQKEIEEAVLEDVSSCSDSALPNFVSKGNELGEGSKVTAEETDLDNDVVMKDDKKSEEPPVKGKRRSYYPLDDVVKEKKLVRKMKRAIRREAKEEALRKAKEKTSRKAKGKLLREAKEKAHAGAKGKHLREVIDEPLPETNEPTEESK